MSSPNQRPYPSGNVLWEKWLSVDSGNDLPDTSLMGILEKSHLTQSILVDRERHDVFGARETMSPYGESVVA
jgi:hypothetical protein